MDLWVLILMAYDFLNEHWQGTNNFQEFSNYCLMLRHWEKISQLTSGSRRATITVYTFWLTYLGCYITINYSVIIFNKNSTNFADVVKTHLVIRGKDGSAKVPQNKKHGGTKLGNKKQSGIEVAFVVCLCMNLCVSLSFSLSFRDCRDLHPHLLSASVLLSPFSWSATI